MESLYWRDNCSRKQCHNTINIHLICDRKSVKSAARNGDRTVFLAVPILANANISGSCVSSAWMHMQAFFVIESLISIRQSQCSHPSSLFEF